MRRIVSILACLVLLSATATATAHAADVSADLDGRSLSPKEISRFYCEDRDYPRIHCYRTARALERAIGDATDSASALAVTASATNYVIVYSSTSFAGSYMYISQDYDTLAAVGWNDRIRSYKGLNSGSGTFWTDWYANGSRQDFCCNAQVPVLSGTYDQKITSVYRR